MKILEILFVLLELLVVGGYLLCRQTLGRPMRLLALFAVSVGTGQLWFDGSRRQMFPAYLAAVLLAVSATIDLNRFRRLRLIVAVGCGLLLASAAAFASFLSIFSLSAPDGQSAIVTVTRIWHRAVRSRDIAPGWELSRKIIVQRWYPGASGRDKTVPCRDDDSGWSLSRYLMQVRIHARVAELAVPAGASFFKRAKGIRV